MCRALQVVRIGRPERRGGDDDRRDRGRDAVGLQEAVPGSACARSSRRTPSCRVPRTLPAIRNSWKNVFRSAVPGTTRSPDKSCRRSRVAGCGSNFVVARQRRQRQIVGQVVINAQRRRVEVVVLPCRLAVSYRRLVRLIGPLTFAGVPPSTFTHGPQSASRGSRGERRVVRDQRIERVDLVQRRDPEQLRHLRVALVL